MSSTFKHKAIFLVSMVCMFFVQAEVIISIPKCGSFLLFKCISDIRDVSDLKEICPKESIKFNGNSVLSEGKFRDRVHVTHAFATKQAFSVINKFDISPVFITRDPRDQVISFAYYIKMRANLSEKTGFDKKTIKEIINIIITDHTFLFKIWGAEVEGLKGKSVKNFYEKSLQWLSHPRVYATTFEKLIGPRGGGNREVQLQEIMNIAKHIGKPLDEKQAEIVATRMFGHSWTFRQGKIGAWKSEFNSEHKELFKKTAGDLLIALGYEKDFSW